MKRELSDIEKIERSLVTTYKSSLWSKFTKAVKTYKLLSEGDRVCVCISGGKDSMCMAKLFQQLHKYSDFPFEIKFLVMNPGYNSENLELIKKNLSILGIDAEFVETNIFDVANKIVKSPCYICARMRRGALYQAAKNLGCNKIALGHHYDDVIETTLMNILNAGSFQTMLPKLRSENYDGMELIRPMFLIREKDIISWSKANDLRFIACACRFTEMVERGTAVSSQRKNTKKLIEELKENYNVNVEKNIFSSAENVNLDKILGYKSGKKIFSFDDIYENTNSDE